uniref:Nucleolar protein 11 n=1 Tax=Zeugodacus cucurbitae TaxID=28588 RepID=A0A0A1WEX3_ZEUCU
MSMTQFLKFANLSRINDSRDFLGISPGGISGSVIITLSRNIVSVVKISSQQQICSWSTQEKFSSKVIFDCTCNKYVGIFGNRYIRCWDASTTDLNSIKKIKLQNSVVDIIPTKSEPIILYYDGNWDLLSEALSLQRDDSLILDSLGTHLKCGNIKDVNASFLINGEQVLTYFVQAEDNNEIELVIIPLKLGGKRKSLKIGRKDMSVTLAGYAIVEGDNNSLLLTIWSDHRLFLLNLDECMESENSPGSFVSVISTLNVDNPLSILGIAKNCVAIYGSNNNQEGASLLLYNTQFKVVKAQQYFKVFFNSSRIWIIDDNILITMGQNLSVVTYRISQELLVDLLGTYNCENFIRIEGDLINEEDYLQSICSYKGNIFKAYPSNYKCINNFQDNSNNLSNYNNTYKNFCLTDKSWSFIKVDQGEWFLNNTVAVLESTLETHLINRTLFEFFIHHLENYGITKQEVSAKLLILLVKSNDSSKITSLLSRLSSAPLSVFAKVFFSILMERCSNSSYENFTAGMLKTCGLEIGVQPLQQITKINDYRSDLISFDLLFLLEYFYTQLTEQSTSYQFCSMKLEMKIFYWFDILLSAYFQQLLLSKDNKVLVLLLKWSELISSYRNQIKVLAELITRLYNLVQKENCIENSNSFLWYGIEDLYF